MKRILIVNVNWLGDVLFSTPFIRALRENFPDAYIATLLHPRCKEILQDNPHLDEIIIYDRKGEHRSFFKKFEFISYLRSKRFDTAFILRRSLSRAMLLFLSKIPERIGYDNKRSGFLLTKKTQPPKDKIHRAEFFLNLLKFVGIQPRTKFYEFFIKPQDLESARSILSSKGLGSGERFIVLNPGGNWDPKRWPKENFSKLGDQIYKRFGLKVVITGANKDVQLAEEISNLMAERPVICCGSTSLKVLGAIFSVSQLVVSNDTGPMHLAASLKVPVIALFGPTSPEITGPFGEGKFLVLQHDVGCNIPCYELSCSDNRCMKAIGVEEVMTEIAQMI